MSLAPQVAELFITDGTDYIDLLFHFRLAQWKPRALSYKDGGVMQSSSIGDGARLVMRYFDNQTETYQLVVKGGHQKSAISDLRRLRQMMEKGADYQTGWLSTPVYLGARSIGENNLRYSTIVRGLVPEDPDPYAAPFTQDADGNALGIVELTIEHWPWIGQRPGIGAATLVASYGSNFAVLVGTVTNGAVSPVVTPISDGSAFLTPKENLAAIEHGAFDLAGAGVSLELIVPGVFVTETLFDTPPAVNQALYFGNESGDAQPGPFCNLIFDIGTAAAGFTIVWEYYNGATWTALTVTDETNGFQNTGIRAVSWVQPTNMAAVAVLGGTYTGWFVRARVTAAPGATTNPTQQNRNVFTCNWPWVRIEDSQIGGDIPALADWRIIARQSLGGATNVARIIAGLRSENRGAAFHSYLNLSDVQNPGTIICTLDGGATLAFANAREAPASRATVFSAASGGSGTITVLIDKDLTSGTPYAFKGKFRVYLRYDQDLASAGDFTVQMGSAMQLTSGQVTYGEIMYTESLDTWQLLDLGPLDILTSYVDSDTLNGGFQIKLFITANAAAQAASATLKMYDIILIPVDEWSGDFAIPSGGLGIADYDWLSIDGIRDPKRPIRAITEDSVGPPFTSTGVLAEWVASTNHYPILQARQDQRLWVLAVAYQSSVWHAYPWLTLSAKVYHSGRYSTMRGTE